MAGHDDNSFGPQYGDKFDFTLRFEHIFFTILPAALLLVTFPVLVRYYTLKPVVVSRSWLLYSKLISAICLFGLEAASLVLWTQQRSRYYSSLAIIASSLSCVAVCCMIGFLDVEHRHSLRSSSLLIIYLTIGVLLDATKSRSCFSRNGDLDTIASLLAAAAAVKGLIVMLQETTKRASIVNEPQKVYGTESTSGFWNRSLFLWLNRTLFLGYRHVLDVDDLEPLDPEFSAAYLSNKFATVWARAKKTPSTHCLMKALLRCLFQPICAVIIPRLCHTAFIFSQPFLLRRVVFYMDKSGSSTNNARGLIGATVLIFLGIAISRAVYSHLSYRLVTLARGVLVSHILDKTLRLEYSKASEKSALSLMSTDIEALVTGLPELHENWVSFVEVGVGIYVLTTFVGRASFLVVLPVILSTMVSLFIGKRIAPARKAWNDKIQFRVSQTAAAFKYIKGIKMLAIESPVMAYIQGLRVAELAQSIPFRRLSIMIPIAGTFAYAVSPAIVIGGAIFWGDSSKRLTAVQAFPALAIIILITLGCIQRIQEFLLLEERQDCRLKSQPAEYVTERSSISSRNSSRVKPIVTADQRNVIISGHQVSIKSSNGSSLLRNASFNIHQAALTVITGPVASGKSVLLRALLGEVQFQGSIHVHSASNEIAYCDQVPWVRNVSVRQNIIGEQPFDLAWYEAILTACLLHEDVRQLVDGDDTLVGSDGASLSGGQKQRLALARALYSHARILILDDVFSGLDAPTSAAITHQLFGDNGLLRTRGITVIMASHSVHHAALADSILFLDGTGNIESMAAPRGLPFAGSTAFAAHRRDSIEPFNSSIIDKIEDQGDSSAEEKTKQLATMEAQEDHSLRRKGDIALYLFYFRSTKAWMVSVWVLLLIVATITGELPPIYVRIWLEVSPEDNLFYIGFPLVGIAACMFCGIMFWFFYYYVLPDSSINLHEMLLKQVMRATLSFITETDSGVILNRFSQDMSLISQDLPRAVLHFIYALVLSIITTAVVLSGARYMAAILPLILLYIYVIQHFYLRTSRQMRFLDLESKTPLYTHISETATGLYYIRAFGLSDKTLHAGLGLLDVSQKPFYYMFCIQRWVTLSMDFAALVITTTLIAFAVLLPNTTSQSAIGLSLVNMVALGTLLSDMVLKWTSVETCLGAIARIQSFSKQTPQELETSQTAALPPNWPQSGHIKINNVTAVYNSIDVPRPVLHSISLEMHPGQRAVLIGRTGSGKSSLILALLNFLEYSGTIFIDGVNIAKVPRHILRSQITTITQDSVELDGSLRYNLLAFKLARSEGDQTLYDADVVEVLSRVHLWEYVTLHGGLDAAMSDLAFSSGQKQLMSIARAVLHHRLTGTKIVLMDEPTSNLDLDTDRHIQKEIFADIFGECTVLMVAHRLETLRADGAYLVVEMADGAINRVTRH